MNCHWGCGHCDAGGRAADEADASRLAIEHANGCAAVAKAERDAMAREAAPEMLELLRDLEWNGDRPSAVLLCPECQGYEESQFPGLVGHEKYCKLAALLARFPR